MILDTDEIGKDRANLVQLPDPTLLSELPDEVADFFRKPNLPIGTAACRRSARCNRSARRARTNPATVATVRLAADQLCRDRHGLRRDRPRSRCNTQRSSSARLAHPRQPALGRIIPYRHSPVGQRRRRLRCSRARLLGSPTTGDAHSRSVPLLASPEQYCDAQIERHVRGASHIGHARRGRRRTALVMCGSLLVETRLKIFWRAGEEGGHQNQLPASTPGKYPSLISLIARSHRGVRLPFGRETDRSAGAAPANCSLLATAAGHSRRRGDNRRSD